MQFFKSPLSLVIILLFVLCLNPLYSKTQNLSKYNAFTKQYIIDNNKLFNNNDNQIKSKLSLIPCFIKINNFSVIQELKSKGVVINTISGNILTAKIPSLYFNDIVLMDNIERIEIANKLELYCDTAKVMIGADKLHSGINTTAQKITGKGVIVGIIDTGIDFFHKEFRDATDTTKSRIISIWSQIIDNPNHRPSGFDYGVEYTKEDIEDELDGNPANFVIQSDGKSGHGTHVACIAAGNRGMAPESEILFVQLHFVDDFQTVYVIDALHYLANKAQELGKPLVINASIGWFDKVPHDGSDLFCQAINNILTEKSGIVFCASAGNDGEDFHHFGTNGIISDSVWTLLYQYNKSFYSYFNIPKSSTESLEFCFDFYKTNNEANNYLGRTEWMSLNDVLKAESGYLNKYFVVGNDTIMNFVYTASELAGLYNEMLVNFTVTNSKFNFMKLKLRGTGSFHSWCKNFVIDTSKFGFYPTIDDSYQGTDNQYMVGIPALADKVIGVGAYANRYTYLNVNNQIVPTSKLLTPGLLATFSSRGPRVDNVIKPDIVAPGHYVSAARPYNYDISNYYLAEDGTYMVISGTSMAGPVVAGGIALLLQKDHTLNYDKVIKMVRDNATKDEQTNVYGELPNPYWGWGKFNILNIIQNSFTNVIDNNIINSDFNFYPNPVSDFVVFNIDNNSNEDFAIIKLSNILGNVLIQNKYSLEHNSNQLSVNIKDLNTGIYFFNIIIGNQLYKGKLIKN